MQQSHSREILIVLEVRLEWVKSDFDMWFALVIGPVHLLGPQICCDLAMSGSIPLSGPYRLRIPREARVWRSRDPNRKIRIRRIGSFCISSDLQVFRWLEAVKA